MHDSQLSKASAFLAAIKRLSAVPAKVIREDTHLRLPITMKIGDAYLCDYLARNPSSVQYLRNEDAFKTRLILQTVNEAWKEDRLPALAICPTERSASALQKIAEIESVTAERFLGDLQIARPVTQTFTGKKSYVIGHDHNPEGRFDKVVLPTLANVIVYEADKFSPEDLTSVCDYVAQVRGRLILCADCQALDRAQPQIGEILNDFFGHEGPVIPFGTHTEKAWQLGNDLDSYSARDNPAPRSADSKPWVIVANCWWDTGVNRVQSMHSSQEEALNCVPAVFAEVWNDYMFLCRGAWTDYEPPSVSTAEWRLPISPEIGDAVRIENHAVASLISLDEHLYLPEDLRQHTRATDPLANTRPFLVFHANSDDSSLFPDHYTLVAKIEAESLDHALVLSQHTEVPWTQYPGVTLFGDQPRSTQVGDVIIDHDVPRRYLGADRWCLATTAMHQSHVQDNASASIARDPQEPETPKITVHTLTP